LFTFTPNGKRLIVANSNAVIVMDTATGMEVGSLNFGPLYDRGLSPSYERVFPITGIKLPSQLPIQGTLTKGNK
jgi:hypothetical protein